MEQDVSVNLEALRKIWVGENKEDPYNTNIRDMYLKIYDMTSKIRQCVKDHTAQEAEVVIDIRGILSAYSINIVEQDMTSEKSNFFHDITGYLDVFDYTPGNYIYTIYLNNKWDELTKRYVMAHEFAHYIILKCERKEGRATKYCMDMMFRKNPEEQICDIMAAFLLMQIEAVLLLMEKFTNERSQAGNSSGSINDWLQYLVHCFKISSYHVALCFQHVRYLGTFLYNTNQTWLNKDCDKYKEFFW